MAGIRQLQERQERWRAERPENTGGGKWISPKNGDVVRFHFIGTGEDDDPYFEVYYSHEIPATAQGKFSTYQYCPVDSEHDVNYDCPLCARDIKTKKRMIMWMFVYDILHTTQPEGQKYPTIQHMGRNYYQEEVFAPRYWETSAWRDSCLDDILYLGASLGNLQAQLMNLQASGESTQRRYKVYSVPNSEPLSQEDYDASLPEIRPVIDMLYEQIQVQDTQPAPEVAPASTPRRTVPGSAPQRAAAPAQPAYQPAQTARAAPAARPGPARRPAAAAPEPEPEAEAPAQTGTPTPRRRGLF